MTALGIEKIVHHFYSGQNCSNAITPIGVMPKCNLSKSGSDTYYSEEGQAFSFVYFYSPFLLAIAFWLMAVKRHQ